MKAVVVVTLELPPFPDDSFGLINRWRAYRLANPKAERQYQIRGNRTESEEVSSSYS